MMLSSVHNFLRKNSREYNHWHEREHAELVNASLLLVFSLLMSYVGFVAVSSAQYDYPSNDNVNPQVLGASVGGNVAVPTSTAISLSEKPFGLGYTVYISLNHSGNVELSYPDSGKVVRLDSTGSDYHVFDISNIDLKPGMKIQYKIRTIENKLVDTKTFTIR